MLIVFDILKFCFAFKLLQGDIVGSHVLDFTARSITNYMVYFSILSAATAFILFYCSCSDFDSLAAF
jgi:hypothetical protein